ncbi:MAG: HD domain-containing protein [Oscillospiraceae bacterium]|nr:HD domain-containing protein [Oscillospiraceae bacterium]
MVTTAFGILLVISVLVIIYMAQKDYENIDIRYWSLVLMVPIILLGYWFKTRVTTTEGAILSFCILYLDSTVLLAVVVFVILHFMRITVKPWVKIVGYGIAFAHLMMIWLCADNGLYYGSISLIHTAHGTVTKVTDGPLRFLHWVYLAFVTVCIFALLVTAIIRKGTYSRRSLWLYTTLMSAGLVVYVAETLLDVDFSTLPILYVLADIMIAMNYDHAHMHDISGLISEQQENYGQKGYAAFDLERRYLSSNEIIYRFLPELADQVVDERLEENSRLAGIFYELIDDFDKHRNTSKRFQAGERICQCEITEFSLKKDGKIQGYLFDVRDVTEEQKVLQVMHDYNDTLYADVARKTENIRSIQRQVVLGLANMVENRDNNTGGHVKRTSDIIGFVVEAVRRQGVYEISDSLAQDIVRAAPMHDLGKITIENAILLKPGKLTDEEFAIMKTHSVKSGEFVNIILRDVEEEHFVSVAYHVARYHHERWDGRGYPDGLVGEMIPLEARIMAIADVYDALVSKRCYKKPMSFEKAAEIMKEGMGTQFDPNMYTVFQDCREQLEAYYRENEDAGTD